MSRFISLRASIGGFVGIIASYSAGFILMPIESAAIVAPMGASAVLAFGVPASPLATPRAVILGNVLSATIGVIVSLIPDVPLLIACALSVGLAIAAMNASKSLHPPGGASALTATLLHPGNHDLTTGFLFPSVPVGLNAVALTIAAIAYHRITGHTYPHRPQDVEASTVIQNYFTREDIYNALQSMPDTLDVEPGDIEQLLAIIDKNKCDLK
ncbi:HPP family protein [Acetobacter pasteurianus]|uniref:HPP family protein n=1 Tax=Acetobacter pasteurianus TaxID=438 RepID=UPI000F58EE5A|nr:HPP family protein [Acetobacter pasteurianus]GCD57241.1 hypothetical protein NBRC3222_2578 [Acetobacter pasteurianus NBRC 3222]